MSVRLITLVFAESETTGNDRLVLLALADEADDDGTGGYPSQERLALKARIPRRTLQRCLARLVERGDIEIESTGRGRGHVTRYTVTIQRHNDAGSTEPEKARKGAQRRAPLAKTFPTHRPIDPEARANPPVAPPTTATAIERDWFGDFWKTYPRRTGKGAARKAFEHALTRSTAAVILDGAERYATDPNLPRDEPQFIPHPATWLNQDRWDDEPLAPRGNGRASPSRVQQGLANIDSFFDKLQEGDRDRERSARAAAGHAGDVAQPADRGDPGGAVVLDARSARL